LLTLRAANTNEIIRTWQVPLGNDGAKGFWKAGEVVGTFYQFEAKALVGGRYHLDVALKNRAGDQVEPIIDSALETTFARIENLQDKIIVRVGE
jgi:hypothetical protein